MNYVYSADGEKLYVEEKPAGGAVQGTEYAANYRIENGTVTMIHTDAGYYTPVTSQGGSGVSYSHVWYLKDHLGNNRVQVNSQGNAIKILHYDPYGTQISIGIASTVSFPSNATESPYKYGGKEWNTTTSTYDFEARYLSPSFHRFTTMDPLAEKYYSISPYAYCAGNPVNLVDPEGLAWVPRNSSSGELTGFDWVDDETVIQENGLLPDGVYHQAIFFTDSGSFNGRSKRNMGSSIAVVYLADGTIQTYNACTYPSNLNQYPTIPEGGYEASVGKHKDSYPALKMYDIGKSLDDNTISLGFVNPAHPNRTNAQGINIHKAGQDNVTGMTSKGKPISAGCMLIDINQWDEFIGHFDNEHQRNNTVGVIVSRSSSSPSLPTYLKYYPYKYIDGMYW